METPCPGPPAPAALAALSHLHGAEIQLKNEACASSEETVQHLEDAIEAIKKLEKLRRHTLELLEEETIKNSNLRLKLQNLPEMVTKELEALVAAARESSTAKITELQTALKNITYEIELLNQKQILCETQNAAMCKEQEWLRVQHEEAVDLLNQQMAQKANTNILLNEFYNKKKDAEQEITNLMNAIKEVKDVLAKEIQIFNDEKEMWDRKNAEMKTKLDLQKAETSGKKDEFEKLSTKLSAVQSEIAQNTAIIFNEKVQIARLKETNEQLIMELKLKVTEKLELCERKYSLDSDLLLLQSKISQERENLNIDIAKTKEELSTAEGLNRKLKHENKFISSQYQILLAEEEHSHAKRNEAATELERLSNWLDERLEVLSKRVVEEQNMEDEVERLEDLFQNAKDAYARELESLEQCLKRESEMRALLQWKQLHLAKKKEVLWITEETFMNEMNVRLETGKKRHAVLIAENEHFQKEILQAEEQVKHLSDDVNKREAEGEKYENSLTEDIQWLEDDVQAKTEAIYQKEQQLILSIPLREERRKELEEKHKKYEDLKKIVSELKDDETRLTKSIDQSVRMIGKLKKIMAELKNELRIKRDLAFDQLKDHTEVLKLLERDIYEVDRKLDIVKTENCRLKLCNSQMKADILTMSHEAENHKSTTIKILSDLTVLHQLFLKGWSEDSSIQKEFVENEKEILAAIADLVMKLHEREKKIDCINKGLQNNFDGLGSLLESKSSMEPNVSEG
ncbi:coiled-coil domain-containing protein 175-like isoform X1 [Gopherus flavomarginatus]|uniref:coiled-coil domain-containing protein 175-like isoform X1 n=2 Tax=Gopherus flavomarginatus TaxID=286002 RepID=UPI0021CBEA88|nr:coiled-coil domain-containing protein 175-like isoform X1 [Gopherus flavomarginatus]XP_050808530.1 coiled-coil domain-containing protein 175-like isoform X1 [Gopherus flavomarginatus]XP_050808531.1 coiled-coil domain-containing protein 175-like isoform X1 [Gopherus flavomarginatus]XP_050808532.1 coiled-coil domain-containing protein 175-like isoform X1 [Gopherus flavomarginatus]